MQKIEYTIQLDVHGPNSADNATTIATLIRSDAGCSAFAETGFDVTPLYAGDPRQLRFDDAEQQIEERWTVDIVLQANIIITSFQDFAGSVAIRAIQAGT
jgi:hypothetical protein